MKRLHVRLYEFLIKYLPTKFGYRLRAKHYHRYLGNYMKIGVGCELNGSIKVGKHVSIGDFSQLRGTHGITIGDYTIMGWNVSVVSSNHRHQQNGIPYRYQGHTGAPVKIGKNVWIGCGTTILNGVTIGDNCIIGANSTITKNIPKNTKAVGINRIIPLTNHQTQHH